MKHLTRSRGIALLLALGLTLAACGRDDEPAADETSPGDGATDGDGGQIATDVGVTEEPCQNAVNEDNGCIYLGIISDLTEGPFRALAVPITDAQKAFWNRVNEQGGVGGYDVDVETYTRDNKYNPEVHNQVYQEIKPNVLALAQTLGSPTTAAIIDDMRSNNVVGAPASWTSLWLFEDVIVESGSVYCVESMNGLDWLNENQGEIGSLLAVAFPGDYGGDGAAGAKIWAETNGVDFSYVEQTPVGLGGTTTAAVDAIVSQNPDVVQLTLSPSETGEIVGGAAARGYQGRFIGTSPSFNPGLLQSAAKDAILALYTGTFPWSGSFDADTPGHQAMREALGDVTGNDGYTSGWVWSYPLKAALDKAVELGDLTREGLVNAVNQVESVDYEGMVVEGAGNFAGDANAGAVRATSITEITEENTAGINVIEEMYEGPTAAEYQFGDGPCYETVSLP